MKKILFTFFSVIFFNSSLYALDVSPLLKKGHPQTPPPSIDFLFMGYRSILREQPHSKYRDDALFASGEYYYLVSDYSQAELFFNQYLLEGKNPERKLFARGYLFDIAQIQKKDQIIKELAKEIRTFKKHTFIFRDFKEYSLNSPLKRKHKAIYSINKIEIYAEEKLLAQISF